MSKGKGFISEFKKFIMRGNAMDMAVGVIVGGAFTSIVTSLNKDILTPLLGIFGGTDFSNLVLVLGSGEEAPILAYGNFITAVINFLITAFVIFCLVKGMNAISERFKHKEEEAPAAPTTKTCPYCKSTIAIDAVRCPHCTSELEK
ncbi:MAG: large conductance mechanosensitive channel protein MscL [Lachnospiraceae bacterium]|nr:large conductance mechanosensitive channel protein MscL [Lachnospiraceae bacterium]